MPPSKSTIFSLIVPIIVVALFTRPPILEDYAKQFVSSVQSVNISVDIASEKFSQIIYSPCFRVLLIYGSVAILTYITIRLYKMVTEPLAIYCNESKVAYFVDGPEGGKTKEERVNYFKRHRKVGDVPPVYPNGWMSVLRSSELKKKEQKFLHVAGKDLAVFRGESGRSFIVDAYCAHLGANLAVGGSVHGDCIECPFHGWRFRGNDGKCVKIAYAEKVPDAAKIPTYHSCEVNQRIYFWHHAEGQDPDWQVPEFKGITDGTMKPAGFYVIEYDGHNEDVPENGADIHHLDYLHGPRGTTGRSTFTDVTWIPHETKKHVASVDIKSNMAKLFGTSVQCAVCTDQIGPCFNHLEVSKSFFGKMIIILTVTPIAPMRQRIVSTAFYGGGPLSFFFIAKWALYLQYYQIEGDIPVWANKVYRRKALLVKEDHLIAKHRKYFAQFYSKNSPRYSPHEGSVDW